jgi:uncharacterized protein YukE
MPQVHGDPEEIRAFARALDTFKQETLEELQIVESQLKDMGDTTWSDKRYREFEEMFEEVSGRLKRGLEEISSEHVPHLRRLAERLEEYESA